MPDPRPNAMQYPWEDFPADAWIDHGQNEVGIWVLELRPQWVPLLACVT